MSTRIAALPVERRFLVRAWFVVSALVIAAAVLVALAITISGRPVAGEGARTNVTGQISEVPDYGPPTGTRGPIEVDGTSCGQCR
ncbi:MAG TPA: hypothetical protein VEC09_08965 [Actinomycetota bacterium]|jgi:hypothetical protein|nr:hypothetical protein [Actinomycetota bacterium]